MENHITPDHMQQMRALIETRLGLDIETRSTLNPRGILSSLAGDNVTAYLLRLAALPDSAAPWQQVVEALTIGETYFFRNQKQFDLLRDNILPRMITDHQQERRLTVWSVGCSTGEEAYSVALTLLSQVPNADAWTLHVVGTDLNANAISAAQRGHYRQWSFRHDDPAFVVSHFDRVDDGFQLRPALRSRVRFQQGNVLYSTQTGWADLILCRNVLLYFTGNAKQRAEERLRGALRPGGWLLLGHAEALHAERDDWVTHVFDGAIAYQKRRPTDTDLYQIHRDKTRPSLPTIHPQRKQPPLPDYAEAVAAFHEKRYERAKRILAEMLNRRANNTEARVLLAAVFANQGAAAEARTHLNIVTQQQPLHADAHYLRGILALEEGNPDAAERGFRSALYSKSGHPLAAFMLGHLRAQAGDIPRAQNLWAQARHNATTLPPGKRLTDFSPYTADELIGMIDGHRAP